MSFLENILINSSTDFINNNIPNWVSPIVVLFIILFLGIIYKRGLKKASIYDEIPKFTFCIFLIIRWISKITFEILGKTYKFATPFFIYIILYFWLGNVISIFGLKTIGSNYLVPATVSIVVLLGTIIAGIFHQRLHYFSDYFLWIKIKGIRVFGIPDPLKFLGELSKIISLSCRLWGNCLAGSIILLVAYYGMDKVFTILNINWAAVLIIPSVIFPLHIYFDLLDGALHATIFMFLTMSYWAIASKSN